jgi:hypothetical protein
MRIRNFTLASAVGQSNGLYFLHGAGIERINVAQFPHVHPVISLFMTVVIEPDDPAGEHKLKVELTERDGRVIDVIMQGSFELPVRPEGADREDGMMELVAHKVGLTVPREGRYWATLTLGEVKLDQVPLYVGALPSDPPPESS